MFRSTRVLLARVGSKPKDNVSRKGKGLYAPGREDVFRGESEMDKLNIEMLKPMPKPPPRTSEERVRLRALMIEYGKHRRSVHLQHIAKVNELLRSKAAALDALPNYRRLEAMNSKPETFPLNRPLFTHTPPIDNFNAADLTR